MPSDNIPSDNFFENKKFILELKNTFFAPAGPWYCACILLGKCIACTIKAWSQEPSNF